MSSTYRGTGAYCGRLDCLDAAPHSHAEVRAEVERSHAAILALTGEVERLKKLCCACEGDCCNAAQTRLAAIRALVEAGDRLADDEDPIDPALEAWAEAKRKAGV